LIKKIHLSRIRAFIEKVLVRIEIKKENKNVYTSKYKLNVNTNKLCGQS